jgi:hypothetical protein
MLGCIQGGDQAETGSWLEDYTPSRSCSQMQTAFFIERCSMPKLFDEIKNFENHLKKKNPQASLLWREDYYEALKYASKPEDVQNMSLSDLFEFVGQKRRFYADLSTIVDTFPKNRSHVKNKNLGGRPADEKGYKAAFLYMTEKKCSLDEAFSWWRAQYPGQGLLSQYADKRRNFNQGIKYWLNK